jgi:transcriptional regulator with XRE-family HTH domain
MANGAGSSARRSSPLVWRRWLGLELVLLRTGNNLSQRDVARELECSVGKISYLESGDRPPSTRELEEVLLPLYHVPDQKWDEYVNAADAADQRGWWDDWEEDDLPRTDRRYVGLEAGASEVRAFQPTIVHGLLQTPNYARAVMRSLVSHSPVRTARIVELRQRRQASLASENDPLQVRVVLDEAVLKRKVGGATTLRAQLDHLAKMGAEQPNVEIRLLPFDVGAHGGFYGPFVILDFGWASDPGLVYLEGPFRSTFMETSREVRQYSQAFDRLVDLALEPDESIEMIRSAAQAGSRDS